MTASIRSCPLCSGALSALPLPHPSRSMLSDGSVLPIPVAKASCQRCGLVSHLEPLSAQSIRDTYGESYSLAVSSPASDKARADAYANFLAAHLDPAQRVLEIGCGSGNLLLHLEQLWPQAAFLGIDPALPEGRADSGRSRFRRLFFNDIASTSGAGQFDLILSVNVIEHLPSVFDFFSLGASLLAAGGRLAMVCPAANPPNLELMFYDHLHTFSSDALSLAARRFGFVSTLRLERIPKMSDFQFAVFSHIPEGAAGPMVQLQQETQGLQHARHAYLEGWSRLEESLLQRIGDRDAVSVFGGGQMAALLRAYAPAVWSRVRWILMDNVAEAWRLGKDVVAYADRVAFTEENAVIVATAPSVQGRVAERLAADGLDVIRFDDLIPN